MKRRLARRAWVVCTAWCVLAAAGAAIGARPGPASAPGAAADWLVERWTVEPFTAAMGGGPGWGPAAAVGESLWAMSGDADGNLLLLVGRDAFGDGRQYVDIVTPEGIRYRLAGTGLLGYRDGPAAEAAFRMGLGAYYGFANIQCDRRGNVFVSDNGNRCIRRIFRRHDGERRQWRVETYAGGGTRKLARGQSCPPRQAAIDGTIMVAAAPDGRLTIATSSLCYQVSPDGRTLTCLGGWPASIAAPGRSPRMNTCGGDCDRSGNAYFVARTPDVVVRVTGEGRIEHLAGIGPSGHPKPHHIGDGPPRKAYFDTPSSGYADPSGACVYVCGGDEYDIRRVPTDARTHTATLLKNGRWYKMPVHPNRNRGPARFDPTLTGKSKVEGGALTNLAVSPLVGRDDLGRLYGRIVPWVSVTQDLDARARLCTRVFRLRRLGPREKAAADAGRGWVALPPRRRARRAPRERRPKHEDTRATFTPAEPIVVGKATAVAPRPPDARAQLLPACAFDGKRTFLVVWQQGRKHFEGPDAKVLAARVSVDGDLLDAKPIVLCGSAGSQDRPRAAFSGGAFLAVWQSFANGKDWDVHAVRVRPDGVVLDAKPIVVAAGAGSQAMPDVAPTDDGFLVAWQDRRSGTHYEVYAARVGRDGAVSPPGGAPLRGPEGVLRGGSLSLVRAGGLWLLAFRDDFSWGLAGIASRNTRRLARLTLSGDAVKVAGVHAMPAGTYGEFAVCLAAGGDRALLVTGGKKRSTCSALGALFDAASGRALANPNRETARGGSGWDTRHAIVLLEPLVPGAQPPCAVGADADGFLVAVREGLRRRQPNQPIRLLRVARDGRKLDDTRNLPVLDDGRTPCVNPAVAAGRGGAFLVAYESHGAPGRRPVLTRIVRAAMRPRLPMPRQ